MTKPHLLPGRAAIRGLYLGRKLVLLKKDLRMGVNRSARNLLLYAKKLGCSFENTLTLGRLRYYASKDLRQYGHILENTQPEFTDEYSEPFFRCLGAQTIESLDYSDYEGADILHDLNQPFPQKMENKYSALVDSGTLEHVFHFPTAIKSCMEALKAGGYFIGITPANNMMGHGFYQLSPELYYRIFSEENGFRIKKLFVAASEDDLDKPENWYEVPDPKNVRSRIMLSNNKHTYVLVIAEKTEAKEVFATTPQQSDYSLTWEVHRSLTDNCVETNSGSLMFFYRKYVPQFLKPLIKGTYNVFFNRSVSTEDLGKVNKSHFKIVDIDNVLIEK